MSSRYDIAVLRDTTLERLLASPETELELGEEVSGPWSGPLLSSIAEVTTAAGTHVVVTAPPDETPSTLGRRAVRDLGVEALFATVRDSLDVYSLEVLSPTVDRSIRQDMDEEPVDFGEVLPEEPRQHGLDEAYVQRVFLGRAGIDPGNLERLRATWYALI
jgi:hypothetical protein